uniref:Capsid protein n=2 Tax=Beihai levi-like virus 21 TaxID=1922407 RepID=A0A1L3KI97_9VIRU|nr:hypothetical protein [Beihai levi-like virus 21]
MPKIANIVINDGTKDITLQPVNIDREGVAHFREKDVSILEAIRLTVQLRQPSVNGNVYRCKAKLVVPVVEVVGNVRTTVRTLTETTEVLFTQDSLGTERQRVANLTKSLAGHATLMSVVQDASPIYG